MSDNADLLEQIEELKAAVEQIVNGQKSRAAGPPFTIIESCNKSTQFTPEDATPGTVILVGGAEYMCVGDHWIDYEGDFVRHDELAGYIRDLLAIGRSVTLLHRG